VKNGEVGLRVRERLRQNVIAVEIGEFIWRIADHLRGDYEKNDNEDVILPFTLLRRLDCVLEKTRDKVRETEVTISGKVTDDVLKKVLVAGCSNSRHC
jgi:type I restriction-modification system DNA methylase subunit